MNVGTSENFKSIFPMLKSRKLLSIAYRSNIKGLVVRNVKEGIMIEPLAEAIFQYDREGYPSKRGKPGIQGVTQVGLDNSMRLRNFVAHDIGVKVVKHKKMGENAYDEAEWEHNCMEYKMVWAPSINIMQMEDSNGTGIP